MKILSVSQLREADRFTIEEEGVPSLELMERAATQCFEWVTKRFRGNAPFVIFCGRGNNGGDGLALARLLRGSGRNVRVLILEHTDHSSDDWKHNLERLKKTGYDPEHIILTDVFPEVPQDAILVDAVLGSGLRSVVKSLVAEFTEYWNELPNRKIAIDIPTGLFGDSNEENDLSKVARADHTLTFQVPKISFLLPETGELCGEVIVLKIGISTKFFEEVDSKYFFTSAEDLKPLLKHRNKFAFKNQMGHGLIVAGSYGKFGACVLASRAFLRSGAGLLTVHIPEKGLNILQTAVPEAMVIPDRNEKMITEMRPPEGFQAVGIGPGIGVNYATRSALQGFFKDHKEPVVLDADALNLIAEHRELIDMIPRNSILTPHIGEFRRLTGVETRGFETLETLIKVAETSRTIVVLKGPYTAIADPYGYIHFNSSGHPAMATAGSGDVLTGMITSFMARGYEAIDAARLGVYIHGRAGEIAAENRGTESVVASDIIRAIPKAMMELYSM